MKYLLSSLYLMSQCWNALCSLPAPVNVSMDSFNFHHVLRWDPGPGTPPGTVYKISSTKPNSLRIMSSSTAKELNLLDLEKTYMFYVQASNKKLSKKVRCVFTPFTETVIGPSTFSLTGCGNCLKLEITSRPLPVPHITKTIEEFYGQNFVVHWRKNDGKDEIKEVVISSLNFTLDNLEPGVEYCVRVRLKSTPNPNTRLSDWMCANTSEVKLSTVPAILAGMSSLILLGCGIFLVLGFGLVYTGFLCKLKTHIPGALLVTLVHDHILTPERMVPDLVSIASAPEDLVKAVRKKPLPATANSSLSTALEEEEEEEVDEGNQDYMDRPVGLSPDTSCGTQSQDESAGESLPFLELARDSRGLTAEVATKEEEGQASVERVALSGCAEAEIKVHPVLVPLNLDENQPMVLGHGMERKTESEREKSEKTEVETPVNVNLFSVTLGTMKMEEEEEENKEENQTTSLVDISVPDQRPLVLPDVLSTLRLERMESQNEIHADTHLHTEPPWSHSEYDRHPTVTDTHSEYLATHTSRMQTGSETDEEEEEEEDFECSGYIWR